MGGTVPPAQEILTKVSESTVRRHSVTYSGTRRYTLHNFRFSKEATVTVRLTSTPAEGKRFTIVERSGAERLIEIIEKLIATEAESSTPAKRGQHDISPANYDARLLRTETLWGHDCNVLELTPRRKSKYLIHGTVWVDKATHGIVRLDGATSANISMWVGSPHVIEDFAPVNGIWLPAHTTSVSSTLLLGESRLEIQYTDSQVR